MIIGMIWYVKLFGKKWSEINGGNIENKQKTVWVPYVIQLILTLIQLLIISFIVQGSSSRQVSGVEISLWMYVGFIFPIIGTSSLWNNESSKNAWTRFLLQAGYQLIMFVIYGAILGNWR
jgi:hypothetical protein